MLEKDCAVIRGDLMAVGFSDRPRHDAFYTYMVRALASWVCASRWVISILTPYSDLQDHV
jgi:hypothetical protein